MTARLQVVPDAPRGWRRLLSVQVARRVGAVLLGMAAPYACAFLARWVPEPVCEAVAAVFRLIAGAGL